MPYLTLDNKRHVDEHVMQLANRLFQLDNIVVPRLDVNKRTLRQLRVDNNLHKYAISKPLATALLLPA